jgi:hypothetical protein
MNGQVFFFLGHFLPDFTFSSLPLPFLCHCHDQLERETITAHEKYDRDIKSQRVYLFFARKRVTGKWSSIHSIEQAKRKRKNR